MLHVAFVTLFYESLLSTMGFTHYTNWAAFTLKAT